MNTTHENPSSRADDDTPLTPETPIGQVVARRPSRTRVFETLGIDYCCGGDRPLAEACAEEDLDPDTVIRMLQATEAAGVAGDGDRDWTSAPLPELIDHIETTHHAFLRRELPRLDELIDRVTREHGDEAPWLESVQAVFADLKPHMLRHIEKEETIVFPFIRQRLGEEISDDADPIALGPQPIKMMEMEHDDTSDALDRLRSLTDAYTAPEWACGSLQAVIDGLRELEQDTHRHVHKENNILFERARSL